MYFVNWCSGELSKIGHHFRKLGLLKIEAVKKCRKQNVCSEKDIFQKKKCFRKLWRIHDKKKLTLKVRVLHFLTNQHWVSSQSTIISFRDIDSLCVSYHIRRVLIGVKYWNWRQTLDDNLFFAILMRQNYKKLNYRLVTYKLVCP